MRTSILLQATVIGVFLSFGSATGQTTTFELNDTSAAPRDDFNDTDNWVDGGLPGGVNNTLPNTGSLTGLVGINGTINSITDFDIQQTAGTISVVNSVTVDSTTWVMTGGRFTNANGGSNSGWTITDSTFTLSGSANIRTAGNGSSSVNRLNNSSIILNSGASIQRVGLPTTSNGGTVEVNTGSEIQLNDGSVEIRDFTLNTGGLITLGATGTFTVNNTPSTLDGIFNWLTGSVVTLKIDGQDATSYESLFDNGNITVNGSNTGSFSSLFSVNGDELTLTVIPEPSSVALMGLAGVIALMYRRRIIRFM